ncbi:3-methyl-2-oxobutanoate hydroxymethyltransferase [Paenibacillus sp. SYP-B3998]|uniref:3-methyl-2-oxobutanoate hydroxymethyltransferase n=1 Tax=Paenibacillus sp. SYP-B3998 TaxID=2678564 RepID=A0A6G3ZWU1_9BACL|nr:3-methyl-2-oxobutanoate hydroxymethyltransferase [Paenibacillus sp. SYP-B3998]NEW06041.1 3-methyl-2-oxobutanoate hydroxymethyltransferase [Paenibacillus sp. SYP-B3998]
MEQRKPLTTVKMRKMKQDGVPITMVTAYDYPSAKLSEEAGIDMILVGDSLGNVVLGYDSTLPVTLEDMVYHSRAAARGARNTFIVTDMPFLTYHGSLDVTFQGVARLMQEGGARAVKLEGGAEIAATVEAITKAGVPVVGHLGLTPQSVHQLGGFRVQGRSSEQAEKLMSDAKALEQAGACAIVLELVTEELATWITKELSIPTIGIGSGVHCDGQVLVYHDLLQYGPANVTNKFVKTYANIGETIRAGISDYVKEVKSRTFPAPENTFHMDNDVVQYLYGDKE